LPVNSTYVEVVCRFAQHTYKHGQLPSFYPMYNSLHCEPEYVFTERVYEVPEEVM
jgi:hypothetical protein